MTVDEIRAKMKGTVSQAIAQSGVNLSSIPQPQQQKMVDQITDSVLLATNTILDEIPKPQQARDIGEEEILWEGHPFLSMVESYILTSERVKIIKGLVSRQVENFELIRIQDIDLKQGMSERMLGIGDITIRGQDPSNPEVVLRNISKPEEVYETMRRAWLEARKRYGLQFREYM
jgi:hypothetical protein